MAYVLQVKKYFRLKFAKTMIKFYSNADRQSIADTKFIWIGGKSGLHGTAYRLMTERGDPTIRATVTNRLKNIG